MTNRVVNVGLVGVGTVGQGLLKIFKQNQNVLDEKAGAEIRLLWACSRTGDRPARIGRHPLKFTRKWQDVVNDPTVDIVVELIGGYEPARTLIIQALQKGKHVATANKAALAKHWGDIFDAARRSHALLYFEASVGSGIPVVQGLNEGLAANRIEKVFGILNGTTNYILTRMSGEGLTFKEALAAAQKAGFAEKNPAFDVEGIDAAHKVALLASLASDTWVRLEEVSREGISHVDVWDVNFARQRLNLITKLLGIVEIKKSLSARVYPALIPASHPFANVNQEYNAVFVHGDAAGDVMFYGKGAGGLAAASAVASDVVYLARQVANGTAGQIPYVSYEAERRFPILPLDDVRCRHYLRFSTADKPGVLSQIAGILGRHGVSIASVYQEADDPRPGSGVPIVIVTHMAREGDVRAALVEANRLAAIRRKTTHLRIEEAR